jgi:catechol 2,3-dioxygenase-like lactoylglutathione lyase family enzyme
MGCVSLIDGIGIMPPKLGQIVETILYTSSVPKLVQWYTNNLSVTPFIQAPGFAGFSLPNNSILLLFDRSTTVSGKQFPNGNIPPHGAESIKGQHIAFACESKETLEEWEQHLKLKGVEIEGKMDWDRGGKSIFFRDGDGHMLEIMTHGVWPVY